MSVSLDVDGTVAVITLDDPATRNALTENSASVLLDAIAWVRSTQDQLARIVSPALGSSRRTHQ